MSTSVPLINPSLITQVENPTAGRCLTILSKAHREGNVRVILEIPSGHTPAITLEVSEQEIADRLRRYINSHKPVFSLCYVLSLGLTETVVFRPLDTE